MKEIQAIRDFNRFYTSFMGLLDDHIYESQFTLPEARVLYELANHQPCTAKLLMENMVIDKSYLSRILKSFENQKLLFRKNSDSDGRSQLLLLTEKGNKSFQKINEASASQINARMSKLSKADLKMVLQYMNNLKSILTKTILE